MLEYIGKSGKDTYLLCRETDECYRFNAYGEGVELLNFNMGIMHSKYYNETKIVSLLGEPTSDVCEIYFNGNTAVIKDNYMSVYSRIKNVEYLLSPIPLRVLHKEENVMQLLVPLKDTLDVGKYLEKILGKLDWNKLK